MPKAWITDENGNRASIERWGNEKKARESLAKLTGCSDCSDCSRCLDCSGCSDTAPQMIVEDQIPVIPSIHRAVFAAVSKPDALNMQTWHTCETTHCRAGWVITLAGEAGKKLEKRTSTPFAAQQIYKASGYLINPCRFYDSDDDAMADMKKLAES